MKKILVIEDFLVYQEIKQKLPAYDVVLTACSNWEQAVAILSNLKPDLIVINLKRIQRIEFDKFEAAIEAHGKSSVIFLIEPSKNEAFNEWEIDKPFDYLIKPFSTFELQTIVKIALFKYKIKEDLRLSEMYRKAILENMFDAVITIDGRGAIDSFNRAACSMFGYSVDEALGKNVSILMKGRHKAHHDEYLKRYLTTGDEHVIGKPRELEAITKEGHVFPIVLQVSQVDRNNAPTFVGLIRDITQHRQDEERISRLAFYDPLTNLPNRRLLVERLKKAVQASIRTNKYNVLMFLDVDHFKILNDTLGHDCGDMLLQQLAHRLQSCVREQDNVYRLGGDEFVLLLECLSVTEHEAIELAKVVGNKILNALRKPYLLNQQECCITSSIGVTSFLGNNETPESALKKADVAMYEAKSIGRNMIYFYNSKS